MQRNLMRNPFFLILSIIMSFYLLAHSQSVGTTSYEFVRNQYSARGAAMGGNLMAIKDDIHAILYNPAALSGNINRIWSVNYVDHLIDFQAGYLSYAQPVKNWGNLSTALLYFNYGNFDETDEFGEITGRSFNASEFALSIYYSNELGSGFDYGIGLKYLYSSLDNYNSSALGLDAGLIYIVPGINDLTLGVSLQNLGITLDSYTDYKDKLPLILQIGLAKRLEHLPLLLSVSLQDLTTSENNLGDRLARFAIGGEFDISKIIKFRLGYQNEINQDVKPLSRTILSGFSLGLGVYWKQFRLDYAYTNYGDLGSQNRIGVTGTL